MTSKSSSYIVRISLIGIAIFTGTIFLRNNKDSVTNKEVSFEENISTNVKSSANRDAEGDTFSIVAYDKSTGQIGGAGCSCIINARSGISFLSDLITDGTTNPDNIVGAIHSQAFYNPNTQNYARNRMLAGDTPQEIIDATVASDAGSALRQYGVVGVQNPGAAGWTGDSNGDYANDFQYESSRFAISVQGNILDTSPNGGQDDILNDMITSFINTEGTLADRLMAAMQGAKRVGGDNRCYDSTASDSPNSSGTTAFIKVLSPGETSPSLFYNTSNTVPSNVEPIDILQCLYDNGESIPVCRETITTFPYTMDFETKTWEQETETCDTNSSWTRSRHDTPSPSTGPYGANQGDLYMYVEASNIDGQGTAPRNAILGSPCFEMPLDHNAELTFDYHMYGFHIGTLSIEVSDDNGVTWTTLWSKTGNQGNTWFNNEAVDLSSYAGSTIKVRLNALMGNGFASDFAVDDIQINVTPIGVNVGATSIVAYDKTTGQIGGAGYSCVPDIGSEGIVFLSDLITDGTTNPDNIVGAIHSQALYTPSIQDFARDRMLAGDAPQQIIDATVATDGYAASRQFGIIGVNSPGVAGWTGSNNGNYANDIQFENSEFTISIQGNFLETSSTSGQDDILNDMIDSFLAADGNLADRLMAAMQGAKRVGADHRCYDSYPVDSKGSSGTTAFIQVLSPGETSPSLSYNTGAAAPSFMEPIDVLQCLYDNGESTPVCRETITTFPYTMDFETKSWEQETISCDINSSWIRSQYGTPSSNTGPSGANQGDLYTYVEASRIDGQILSSRNAILGSPCFDIPVNHTVELTFDYHMYGIHMGTLSFEVSDDNGATWTSVWSKTGNQGNNWFNDQAINLSTYAGSTIKIRLNALMSGGFLSDFGVDDIQLKVTAHRSELLSTNDLTKNVVAMYPNPADKEIQVSSNEEIQTLIIFDMQGRKVRQKTTSGIKEHNFDLFGIESGVYFMEITTPSGKILKKFIKK